ncbi:alpha-L-fucosidase [Lentzea tibetensis]|uniref:alpha-L-fucosidase n=1 Tax=Lentzea tibetensis TaxID=2591470 RepID=A0A563EYC0_9PSEU|nr:alpha-L-fucosidase [Lentzea tibetensis]TWP52696.1 alpha-L-fucosidase [Lentzea tibetensis]
MRAVAAVLALVAAMAAPATAAPSTPADDAFTSPRTQWWRDAKFGMFIHFGTYAYWGGEYTRKDGTVCQDAEWIQLRCEIPWAEYEAGAKKFNPAKFDAGAITQLAKDAGQRYVVFTAKHHDGYAMWPTKTNKWNLRDHSSFDRNRDVLAELKREADKKDIRFGLYYSITDWHDPGTAGDAAAYKKTMREQLTELVRNYHPATLWFDGHAREWWTLKDGEDLQDYLRKLDPNLIINDRVGKSRFVDGDHETPERHQNIPAAPIEGTLWESCVTTSNRWGWARYDTAFKPASQLTRFLTDIVGRDGNLLQNVGPDNTGVIPEGAANSLRGVGDWLRANGQHQAVYGTALTGLVADPAWGAVSRKGDKLYLSVYDWGPKLHLTAKDNFGITGAKVLGSDQEVTWQKAGDGYDISPKGAATNPVATVVELTITAPKAQVGHGIGLKAQYWKNPDFTGKPATTKTEPTLNFAWRQGGSPQGVGTDNFAARWTGFVQPQFTGEHTFLTVSDETVKVWVDGKVVIDNTTPHGPKLDKGTVTLQAGKRYSIRVDYTERTGEAYLKLLWSNPNRQQHVIPATQLYPM